MPDRRPALRADRTITSSFIMHTSFVGACFARWYQHAATAFNVISNDMDITSNSTSPV